MINGARQRRDVAVIGGSAGAIESLLELVGKLPTGFEAAVAIVVHLNPYRESKLADVLARVTTIPVAPVSAGAPFECGHAYVAVADHHLLVGPRLSTSRGPKEHLHRPAIDPLFRSAAASFGARVVGVLLSGSTTDGVTGAAAIRAAGGIVLVQDPAGARYSRLPATALTQETADASASNTDLAEMLTRLSRGEALDDR